MAKTAPPTYYVFHGADQFTRQIEVRAMKARMGSDSTAELNISVYDGTKETVTKVLSDAKTSPFLSDKRLLIVNDMLSWLTRKGAGKEAAAELAALVAALPALPEYTRLVFVEPTKLPDAHPVLKLMQTDSHGFQKEFKPIQQKDQAKELPGWIVRRAVTYDAMIEPHAAILLAQMITADLFALDNELAKLSSYVNGERDISEADVMLLTTNSTESKLYELTDKMGRRQGREAVAILQRLLDAREEPIAILGMMNGHFRRLLQAKTFVEEGGDARELESVLNIAPYPAKLLKEQMPNFTLQELETIYRSLLDTDWKVKTGQLEGILALDLLVAGLAA